VRGYDKIIKYFLKFVEDSGEKYIMKTTTAAMTKIIISGK
jgi:hypothetical protein